MSPALPDKEVRERMQVRAEEKLDFERFMNDRGEIRQMPFNIMTTKVLRNKRLERWVIEENRERTMYYVILAGCILFLFGLM